jgi:hypothetical protein
MNAEQVKDLSTRLRNSASTLRIAFDESKNGWKTKEEAQQALDNIASLLDKLAEPSYYKYKAFERTASAYDALVPGHEILRELVAKPIAASPFVREYLRNLATWVQTHDPESEGHEEEDVKPKLEASETAKNPDIQ